MSSMNAVKGSLPMIVKNTEQLYEGDLLSYFHAFFFHAQNLHNPYHNFRHVGHVLWQCYDACQFYKTLLSPRQMRDLLIAALFHDFDHSGRPGPDRENIDRAVNALCRHLLAVDWLHLDKISELIRLTEYPYTVACDQLNPEVADGLMALVLRDADMSQALSPAWIQQVPLGLATEWGKSPLDVLKMQVGFHQGLRFNTGWARGRFTKDMIAEKIEEAQELYDLLTAGFDE